MKEIVQNIKKEKIKLKISEDPDEAQSDAGC